MKLYLLRHGETQMNVRGAFCGFSDPPLSDTGKRQARQISATFSGKHFDRIYSSPLKRAVETAQIVTGSTENDFVLMPAFKEMNFGNWEGLTYSQIKASDSAYVKAWEENNLDTPCLGGESMRMFHERVISAFKPFCTSLSESDTILLVAHSGVIRSILTETLQGSIEGYWRYRIDNCGLAVLDFVDGFPVLTHLINPFLSLE